MQILFILQEIITQILFFLVCVSAVKCQSPVKNVKPTYVQHHWKPTSLSDVKCYQSQTAHILRTKMYSSM